MLGRSMLGRWLRGRSSRSRSSGGALSGMGHEPARRAGVRGPRPLPYATTTNRRPGTPGAHGARHRTPRRTVRKRRRTGRTGLSRNVPRPPKRPPGRGVGPRSHAGWPRGHRGRHPNGPTADTHRPAGQDSPRGGPRRRHAQGGGAAADSGIPAAARPVAPGAGGRRAAGHDRRLPPLPTTTLHQPSDRQGPRSASLLPGRPAGLRRATDPPESTSVAAPSFRLTPATGWPLFRHVPRVRRGTAVRPAAGGDGADGLRTVRQHGVVAINFSKEAMQSGQCRARSPSDASLRSRSCCPQSVAAACLASTCHTNAPPAFSGPTHISYMIGLPAWTPLTLSRRHRFGRDQ